MPLLIYVAAAIALVAGLYLLVETACVRGILRSYRRTAARVQTELGYHAPADFGLAHKDLEVEVAPGIVLYGWLLRTQAPRRGVLVYHHGIWDAAAPRLPLAARMVPHGFDCLLYDSRGQGRSGGRYCTYGKEEHLDLARMLDHIETLGVDTSRVVVVGHSMGGATAVYAARTDRRITSLVLEACYRDLPTAVRDYARLFVPLLPDFIIRRALRRAGARAGFDATRLSPLAVMPELSLPVLFVHGTADRKIKPRYSQEHYDAKPEPRDLHWVKGAHHGRVWHEGGEAYMKVLENWLCSQMPVTSRAES